LGFPWGIIQNTHPEEKVKIVFWGVRGSVPTPRKDVLGYGGNTTCVQVFAGGQEFIIDAGTGIIELGHRMISEPPRGFTLLLTHLHHDHTQGFPFFRPAFSAGFGFDVYAGNFFRKSAREVIADSMSDPYFPVPLNSLASRITFKEIAFDNDHHLVEGLCDGAVDALRLFHPREGVVVYRFREGEKTLVFATDCEHYPGRDELLEPFIRNADIFVYDTMYTDEEYKKGNPPKIGWGHSTIEHGLKLASRCSVGKLICTHHDPAHSDAFLDEMFGKAREVFPETIGAYEGLALEV